MSFVGESLSMVKFQIDECLSQCIVYGKKSVNVLENKYAMKDVLGGGKFSQVRLAERKESPGNLYAIKLIDKKAFDEKESSLENKIQVLSRLHHPNIVEIF